MTTTQRFFETIAKHAVRHPDLEADADKLRALGAEHVGRARADIMVIDEKFRATWHGIADRREHAEWLRVRYEWIDRLVEFNARMVGFFVHINTRVRAGERFRTAVELWRLLDPDTPFNDWADAAIADCGLEAGLDYLRLSPISDLTPEQECFFFTEPAARHIELASPTAHGERARNECIQADEELRALDPEGSAKMFRESFGAHAGFTPSQTAFFAAIFGVPNGGKVRAE